jgi:hypothetical protein
MILNAFMNRFLYYQTKWTAWQAHKNKYTRKFITGSQEATIVLNRLSRCAFCRHNPESIRPLKPMDTVTFSLLRCIVIDSEIHSELSPDDQTGERDISCEYSSSTS